MNKHLYRDAAAVEQAVAQVAAIRPAYASMLGFYGPVFVAQEKAAAATAPGTIPGDDSQLEIRSAAGQVLIEPGALTVDVLAAADLLRQVCRSAAQAGQPLGGAADALTRAMDSGTRMADLFVDLFDDQGRIGELAATANVPPKMIALLLYLAVKPGIEAASRRLAHRLPSRGEDPRGRCPICDSAPIVGELDAEGRQWVHCGLCWHRWPANRLACPFCRNRENNSLEYLYSEEEPEYRVNLCNACKGYLKVVDTRKLKRLFYPPLEQVVTLHLDLLAAEKGYIQAVAPAGVLH
jgi:FdhE protein